MRWSWDVAVRHRVAVASGLLAVLLAGATVTADRASATFPGANGKIAASRDGDIVTMNADGTGEVALTNAGSDYWPTWSPNGAIIAFTRYSPIGSSVWVVNADGSGVHQASDVGRGDLSPSTWSADGTWIAFWDDVVGQTSSAIWRVTADGLQRQRLTSYASRNVEPSWSPTGSGIAWVSNADGDYDIWSMSADGSGKRKLTRNRTTDLDPAWAPNGSSIVFAHQIRRGGAGGVVLDRMLPDGSGLIRLTDGSRVDRDPAWAPDSSAIVFRGDVNSPRGSDVDLYSVRPDGTGLIKLTGAATLELTSGTWSPDSSRIVFADDYLRLYRMDANGANQTLIASDPAYLGPPDWQAVA